VQVLFYAEIFCNERSMIIFTVRTHGPYAVTKCYLPYANYCTCCDGIFL